MSKVHKSQKIYLKNAKSKVLQSAVDFETELLDDILRLLQTIYKIRLIEKISRPIETPHKQNLAIKAGEKVKELHIKLQRVLRELSQKATYDENFRERSVYEELTSKSNQLRKKIRSVESRYNEVFIQGSFKHYRKIQLMFNLDTQIEVINIQDWAATCLSKINGQGETCC